MWNEKILKIVPAILFLFSILEMFEMFLIVANLNNIEKIEVRLKQDLEISEMIVKIYEHLEHCKKKNK